MMYSLMDVSDARKAVRVQVTTEFRSGKRVVEIARRHKICRQYVYVLMSAQERIENFRMERFYERRQNLGRPIDMGGPRDVWIDYDLETGETE